MTGHAAFTTSPRHPVRWFVATMVGVVALLVVVWWLGLTNPRVSAAGSSTSLEQGEAGVALLFIDNDGMLPVRVLEARPFGDEVAGTSLGMPVRIPGGEQREVEVQVTLQCKSSFSGPSGVRLRIATLLGVHRDLDVTDLLTDRCR